LNNDSIKVLNNKQLYFILNILLVNLKKCSDYYEIKTIDLSIQIKSNLSTHNLYNKELLPFKIY